MNYSYNNYEEKLRNDLKEKGYIDRKEFTKYLRSNNTKEDIYKAAVEEEKNPIKKVFKAFLLQL